MNKMLMTEPSFPSAILCDVDGTLVDVRSIRHFVEGGGLDGKFKANFNRFHSESIDCPPHISVVHLLRRARALGMAIVIVSAREEKWSFVTTTWLAENDIVYDELIMRRKHDYRSDAIIKQEMIEQISGRYRARLAVDDRSDIIEVWQQAGIPTSMVSIDGNVGPIKWPPGRSVEADLSTLVSDASIR